MKSTEMAAACVANARFMTLCIAMVAVFLPAIARAQPANDAFANRAVISGGILTVTGSLASATSEPGEPFIPGVSGGQTAWWSWNAPSNGIMDLSVGGTSFNPLLEVYVGTDLAGLSLVASNNYVSCYENVACGCHWLVRNHISFHVARHTAYQIVADSPLTTEVHWVGGPVGGPIQLITTNGIDWFPAPMPWQGFVSSTNVLAGGDLHFTLSFSPAPKNDDFNQATILQGSRIKVSASNAGATKEPGEPAHGGNPGGSSVWYSWKAPAAGRVTLSTNEIAAFPPPSWSDGGSYGSIDYQPVYGPYVPSCGNDVDQNPPPTFFPILATYFGSSLGTLVPVNSLSLNLPAYPDAVGFDVAKGQACSIAFDGNMGTTGETTFYLAFTGPAANDNFARRIKMHGVNVLAHGYNAGATHEKAEPAAPAGSAGKSVWWSWIAPVSGPVTILLNGSDYSFPVAVYTGTALSRLKEVASGSGGISFQAKEGQSYQIAVSDYAGLTGGIQMQLQAPVNEAPLARTMRGASTMSILLFAASPGQVLVLQSSNDRLSWTYQNKVTAHSNTAMFLVHQPAGQFYRALIIDRL